MAQQEIMKRITEEVRDERQGCILGPACRSVLAQAQDTCQVVMGVEAGRQVKVVSRRLLRTRITHEVEINEGCG